jgi:hypothetical protein
MATKLRAQYEGLAIRVTMAAVLAKDIFVKLTADNTVNAAGANEFAIGRVTVPARTSGGIGTVETRFKEKVEFKVAQSGGVAAGDYLKLAAVDGTTGETRVAKWVSGTDAFERFIGVCSKGAADTGTCEALIF